MRLLTILFFTASMAVHATPVAQTVSISVKNMALKEVMGIVEKQTGYSVFGNRSVWNNTRPVTVSVVNTPLNSFLTQVLTGQGLSYRLEGKTISLYRKDNIADSKDKPVPLASADPVEVKGKVTDDQGQPLAGVFVSEEGVDKNKTLTDGEGNFKITVANSSATLKFTYVGYTSEVIVVKGKEQVSVKLSPSVRKLDEVTVVGYGSQLSRSVTGSITKVDMGQVANLSTTSVDQQLAGRAAGVQVTVNSGNTNSNPRIRIRGINSINNSRDPLIVIDGVPVSTGDMGGNTTTNALADINPDDILSMDVLKDGAASAIYGSRAANGVVLITTKHGSKGQLKVNYDAYASLSGPVKTAKLLNAQQFVEIANEKYTNSGVTTNPAVMDASNTNTDWQDLIYHKNAFSQSHSLGISGGSDKTTYFFSVNYLAQQGAVIKNATTRYGIRANVDHQVNKIFKIGTSTSVTKLRNVGVNNSSGLSTIITNSLIALPNVSPYDAANATGYNLSGDGKSLGAGANLQTIDDAYPNILFSLNNDKYSIDKYRILNTTYGELTLLPGLKYRIQGGVDIEEGYDFYALDSRHGDGYSYSGLVKNTTINRSVYNLQHYITYTKSFLRNNITLTAGNEVQKNTYKNAMAGGSGFSNYFFQQQNLITGTYTTQLSGGSYSEGSFLSYFGRLNYDYAGKYLLGLTIRRDGLSSLANEHRFGTFPGASIGWRASDEDFWKHAGIDRIIPSLKIRASYGKVGNALTGFPYLSTYGASPYGAENGISITNVGNSSLQWETSKKYDAGLEAGILNNRITVAFDWFKNNIDNLVMDVTYPNSFGIPGNSVTRNIGAMVNHGIELTVSADVIKQSGLTWSVNANFTKVNNKVTKLYQGQTINGSSYLIKEGAPLYAMIGYRYAGVNEMNGNPMYYKADGRLIQGNISNQLYYYADSKTDNTMTSTTTLTDDDKAMLGSPTPTWYGGITNSLSYKNFSLDAFIRFSGGNKIDNSLERTLLNQKFKNNGVDILNRWTPTNTITDVPKLWYGKEAFINLSPGDRWVQSGDYLRLQTATLSYTLDKTAIRRIAGYLSSLRVYVTGQNLVTLTRFKGLDPDLISETGASGTAIPIIRSFSFGVNLGF
ncbi:hypothetical protein A3860_11705 [Niastella vici]|uniref:Secretin/TonB short N-terminal domain-containing protein n=1 Tax=Niastella vici TaxID=1703345 RepID=A0A1V9FFT4_9BACT|nr:TonB-dependent receptor [Niastella vici]OQP57218.1 hypothetical protein A3860_11705 [Niastella vici]